MSLLPVATALVCAAITATAMATDWNVDYESSRLGFVATYDGVGFETRFERFNSQIRFDPRQLAQGMIDVAVDVTSINSNSADRDEGMLGSEWFNAEKHPEARFVSTSFRQTAPGTFEVTGRLTIKEITHSIVVPYVWTEVDNDARLKGKTKLRRTDYRIGIGAWQTDPIIGFEVEVIVDLRLERKN